MSFSFGGERRDYIKVRASFVKVIMADIERKILEISGSPGGFLTKSNRKTLEFTVPIDIVSSSSEQLAEDEEDIADFLYSEEPKELIFDYQPDRSPFAVISGSLEAVPVGPHKSRMDISFICPKPFRYGPEKVDEFRDGLATVINDGNTTALPIYEIDVLEDITSVDIFTDESYMRIGREAKISDTVYQRQTNVLSTSMSSLVGWSTAQEVDNGYIGGEMVGTSRGVEAKIFGEAQVPHMWQGPSIIRSLPTPLQNFRLDARVDMINNGDVTGMIEIYLRDQLDNVVAKIGIEDIWQSAQKIQGKMQLGEIGDRYDYRRIADRPPAWNNFSGMIRLHRDGNRIRPYFGLVDKNGKHTWTSAVYLYTDYANKYQTPISKVQIAIRIFPGKKAATMRLRDLKIWRYNDRVTNGVPVMAEAGDKIVIDTNDNSIRLNGEKRPDLKDLGASFFKINRGLNQILIQPQEKLSAKVIYRERF